MNHAERRRLKQILSLLMALLLFAALPVSLADVGQAAPLAQADSRSQMVRVHLSRLNITDRMDITLSSAYGMTAGEMMMHFSADSELSILLRNSSIYVYYQGMSLNAGTSLSLTRHAGSEGGGFRLTNYPALYAGDLRLEIIEDKIRPVLTIHVEDYLLGVVPYEMSNSFPLEALKAQAVTARTYALRKQNAKKDYDLVDTTNDQVYKGYIKGAEQAELAVKETRGICGFYKGKLAQCYYAASNGGQTEQVAAVWATDDDFSYYAVGTDQYDLENPSSTVRTFKVNKKPAKDEAVPLSFRALLANQLSKELTQRGFDPSPESVRVDEVSELSVDTPKDGQKDSRLLTMLQLTVKISGRTRTDAPVKAEDLDTEEVSIQLLEETAPPTRLVSPAPSLSAEAAPTIEPTPSPTPKPTYGRFTPIDQSFSMSVPIFPAAEQAMSLDISGNYDNELWTVVESKNAYEVQARRYGHGVGMSQRGAEWMAARYDKTYLDILAFYYPGMELKQYPENDLVLPRGDAQLQATAGPPPTPTPRPTLIPTTLKAEAGQWFALVTGIDEDSSLNLRSKPDLSGDIVMRLFKNQRLLVLERCAEEGWVKVKTDAAEGYVAEKYLSKE